METIRMDMNIRRIKRQERYFNDCESRNLGRLNNRELLGVLDRDQSWKWLGWLG
jgi:hypothetical protein